MIEIAMCIILSLLGALVYASGARLSGCFLVIAGLIVVALRDPDKSIAENNNEDQRDFQDEKTEKKN